MGAGAVARMTDTASRYWRGAVTWRRRDRRRENDPGADLRVGYFMNQFPNLTETFVYRELRSVRARGVDVVPFAIRRPATEEVSAEARVLFDETHYVLPLPILGVAAAHLRAAASRPLRYARVAWETIAGTHERQRDRLRSFCHFVEAIGTVGAVRAAGVQHLHAHFAVGSATCAWVLSRYLGLPFSFTAHAYDIWLDRLLLPEKLRDACFAVTCTEENRRHLLANYAPEGATIHVIHHGVDAAKFRPSASKSAGVPRILSVGRLCEQKGFATLLRACAELHRDGEQFECHIIGDGPLGPELRQLAAQLGLQGRVRFLGRAFQEELPGHYAAAHIFALACTQASDDDRDGIPNTLMEAMACGLPVVSTRFSGIPELVDDGENGLLAPPNDSRALASALRRLLRDEQLRASLGARGRDRVVSHFTLEGAASSLVQHFRAAAERPQVALATESNLSVS
jgi:glycosyltransferase involved in cell wall biosynthesis